MTGKDLLQSLQACWVEIFPRKPEGLSQARYKRLNKK